MDPAGIGSAADTAHPSSLRIVKSKKFGELENEVLRSSEVEMSGVTTILVSTSQSRGSTADLAEGVHVVDPDSAKPMESDGTRYNDSPGVKFFSHGSDQPYGHSGKEVEAKFQVVLRATLYGLDLKSYFTQWDTNKSGFLELDEFFVVLRSVMNVPEREFTDGEVEAILRSRDIVSHSNRMELQALHKFVLKGSLSEAMDDDRFGMLKDRSHAATVIQSLERKKSANLETDNMREGRGLPRRNSARLSGGADSWESVGTSHPVLPDGSPDWDAIRTHTHAKIGADKMKNKRSLYNTARLVVNSAQLMKIRKQTKREASDSRGRPTLGGSSFSSAPHSKPIKNQESQPKAPHRPPPRLRHDSAEEAFVRAEIAAGYRTLEQDRKRRSHIGLPPPPQPLQGSLWACSKCVFSKNLAGATECLACGASRQLTKAEAVAPGSSRFRWARSKRDEDASSTTARAASTTTKPERPETQKKMSPGAVLPGPTSEASGERAADSAGGPLHFVPDRVAFWRREQEAKIAARAQALAEDRRRRALAEAMGPVRDEYGMTFSEYMANKRRFPGQAQLPAGTVAGAIATGLGTAI